MISEEFDRPVFVHRFPAAIKAFYMQPDPANPTLSLSAISSPRKGTGRSSAAGSAFTISRFEKRLEEEGLPKKAFQWYLDLRRYGTFPHAGFGLGVERTLSFICGLTHVRETIPFPRLINRLAP